MYDEYVNSAIYVIYVRTSKFWKLDIFSFLLLSLLKNSLSLNFYL